MNAELSIFRETIKMRWLPVFVSSMIMGACSTQPSVTNKFSDPVIARIYDLQDRRSVDSLLTYLHAENVNYRREAALAFGSVQDSLASIDLGNILLEDPDTEVRMNAAFSLGQTPGFQSVNALIPALQDKEARVVREVLEALGKTLELRDLDVLRNFTASDSLTQEGLAWAFYRLALRNKADSLISKKAAELLNTGYSLQTRLGAANYFGRPPRIPGNGFDEALIKAATQDIQADVRMMAVSGLRQLPVKEALPYLEKIVRTDKDYRVRINAIRACLNFPLTETQSVIFDGLKDSEEMVQIAASEVIRNLSDRYPLQRISEYLHESKNWRVKSNLYGALLKSTSRDDAVDEIIDLYGRSTTYFRSALASSLGEARPPQNKAAFTFLSKELTKATQEKVIQTSCASALVSLDRKSGKTIVRKDFLEVYKLAIGLGDAAVIGIIASALTDTALHYKSEVKDLDFLYAAKAKLVLPKDIESQEPLDRAIAYLEGREKPKPLKNEYNHPIEWKRVATIPPAQKVFIKTNQGEIVLRLYVEEAPGSVANFIDLIEKKYFDGKFFHRVVPNFVIQTGCNRGDGFGSEDYSIRSEFSLRRYASGSVGMASAGKDTEGTQWFITHSPTPHLDGRYSLFAGVEKGQDVVNRINVGDKILEAKIMN